MERFTNGSKYYLNSYQKELFNYLLSKQLLDENTYSLFVNQFRLHSDDNFGWRGEFWGKLMRGACLSYKFSKNEKLYRVLTSTVRDIIHVKDKNGRISTYPLDKEFTCWDMWSRKYVMLGLLSYYDICKSESLKKQIIKSLVKQANYIVKHVGNGKNQIDIYKTSNVYGGMNSSSIVSPMVQLYKLTNDQKYLDFAEYIVNTGFAGTFNLIDASLDDNLMPYQFKETKAYEMMACLSGLLEYYLVKPEKKYLDAVIKYVDKLIKSDYTVIGCAGCNSEFLDNSSITQTQFCEDVCQETCVSVTLIDLCSKLFCLTKDEKYISIIERSTFNDLYGSVNNENQTMENANAYIWLIEGPINSKHESYPYDSYSPLYRDRRGKLVAGFMKMQEGRSYGCCAAIGSYGFAISTLLSVYQENESSYYFNLYNKEKVSFSSGENKVVFNVNADIYNSNFIKIKVDANNQRLSLNLRIPSWMKNVKVFLDDNKLENIEVKDNYLIINQSFLHSTIKIKYSVKVDKIILNDKVYFEKGPIVLTSDMRFGKESTLLSISKKDIKRLKFKKTNNNLFSSNLCMNGILDDKIYKFVDYSQAGKNYDDKNSQISVFFDIK